jgi:5-methylcytosine-specific restriction enzyme subunit McrC
MKHYTICEYQSFTCEIELHNDNYKPLKADTFNKLKQFILENKGTGETEGLELMSHYSRKGIGEIITAKNYVGVIAMPDGTVIEVLPKIANSTKVEESQKLLLAMLKTVKDLPFKTFNMAHLNVERIRIFEVFISMFINEVKLLVHGRHFLWHTN